MSRRPRVDEALTNNKQQSTKEAKEASKPVAQKAEVEEDKV